MMQNPFNGIERVSQQSSGSSSYTGGSGNPFNGIERIKDPSL
jgi:hypothetical protein